MKQPAFPGSPVIAAAVLLGAFALPAAAAVERYKVESEYLARLAELGYENLQEDFEGSDWDGVRSNYPIQNYAAFVTSKRITWASAGQDLWTYPGTVALISTNQNWARTGWGIFDNYLASTKRITAPEPIYGIGFWVKTNPGGQDIGILFEDRTTATEPGYVLPGYGAMYPGDIHPFGHGFVGFVDPDGFNEVIVTGTLEVNEEGQLEGGTVFGADDFTFAVAPGFQLTPLENWRIAHFSAPDLADPAKEATVWGNGADPDGDGLNNDGEFGLGTNPRDARDGDGGVIPGTVYESGQVLLKITYRSRNDDSGLTINAAVSGNLSSWNFGPGVLSVLSAIDQGDGYDIVTVVEIPAVTPRSRSFGRIFVTRTSP